MTGRKSEAASPSRRRAAPSPWWRYLLAYPTLAVALLTAVPQWIDKFQTLTHKVDSGDYAEAELQRKLYAKNMDCTTAPMDWVSNPSNINLDATICESGDIYARATTPTGWSNYYFIPVERVLGKPDPGGRNLLSGATAAGRVPIAATPAVAQGPSRSADLLVLAQVVHPPPPPSATVQTSVVCTKFIDSRRVLRHLRTSRTCFDEVVDTLNRRTVSRNQVACRSTC